MVLISKIDKKTWDNYISNLQKIVILPSKKDSRNLKKINKSTTMYKSNTPLSYSKLYKKRNMKPDGILDLHGHSLYSGKLTLNKFIINCYEEKLRNILIITGKGFNNKGALKEEVPKWLNEKFLKRYLVNFDLAPKHFGGEGALLVRIKNKYKNQY